MTHSIDVGRVLTALLLALVGGCGDRAAIEFTDIPRFDNLVVVMIDTLRTDAIGSYGSGTDLLPYLSSLAAEGVQLQGYSASSWTRSSVATLLTGLHPQTHRVVGRTDALSAEPPLLPQILAGEGFHTAAVVTNGNVSQLFGFSRGFDRFELELGAGKPDSELAVDVALGVATDLERRFFFYIHLIDPHTPYVPDSVIDRPDLTREDYIQPQQLLNGELDFSPDNVQQLKAQYDSEVSEMDPHLERLLLGLEDLGLLESTLIVFTSDHGEEFNEHGNLAHGFSLYEEVVRVPMILWAKNGLRPIRSAAPFHQVDFSPTMLDALGIEPPAGMDGRSVWEAVTTGATNLSEELLFHLDMDGYRFEALTLPPVKLVRDIDSLEIEVYDLARDPAEQGGGSFDWTTIDRLEGRLGNLKLELQRQSFDAETAIPTHNIKQQLEALGYLGGDGR